MLCVLPFLLLPCAAVAQSTVVIVRHAERADAGMAAPAGADPDLSEAGRARAESLSAILKDAQIRRIFVTEFKRTRQTAQPLATRLEIEPEVVASNDATGLAARVKSASGNALVVGHSNTLPAVLKALGVDDIVAVADAEFDNLFVVTLGERASLVRLRYR